MVKRPPKPTFEHLWKEVIKPALMNLNVELNEKDLAICNMFMRKLWDYKSRFGGRVTKELIEITRKEIEDVLAKYSEDREREKIKLALLTIADQFGINVKL